MMKKSQREEGAVAVIVAISLVVLLGAVALTFDVGGLLLRRREMVNGTDSAALAAALTYVRSGSTSGIQSVVEREYAANSPGSVSQSWSCTYRMGPDATLAKGSVIVDCTSQQPLYFAPVLGFDDSAEVNTSATASWRMDGVITG